MPTTNSTNILSLLRTKLATPPPTILPGTAKTAVSNPKEADFLRAYGIGHDELRKAVADSAMPAYERMAIYSSVDRALAHPIVAAAANIFAESATNRDIVEQKTVWATAKNKEYKYQLDKLLETINIEEVIYDWAFSTGVFGDHFIEVYGEPGVGVISVNDDAHPACFGRVDWAGRLIGFVSTPLGMPTTPDESKLIPPWAVLHFRLLGAKKRRPLAMDGGVSMGDFRTMQIMSPDPRRLTSKYGTSLLTDALPVWKRLRLVEDSIMIARIMHAPERYIFKLIVDSQNSSPEGVAQLINQYADVLKRSRNVDLTASNPAYGERYNALAGCFVGDTKIELIDGTSPTIKTISDNKDQYIGKYVLTVNPKTLALEPKRIIAATKTRSNAELVEVTLDSKRSVKCTPDHRFMLRDGSYKEAKDLQPGESLMPLYTKMTKSNYTPGYKLVYNVATKGKSNLGEYIALHKIVADGILGSERDYKYEMLVKSGKEKRLCIHHKDFNKLNNEPGNLQWLGDQEHWHYHADHGGAFFRSTKGKTLEEVYGKDRAHEIKDNRAKTLAPIMALRKGKKYEEILGPEKGAKWRKSVSDGHKGVTYSNRKSPELTEEGLANVRASRAIVKDRICKYCGEAIVGTISQLGGHVCGCPKNPKNIRKLAEEYETRKCQCSPDCKEEFVCKKGSGQKYANHEHYGMSKRKKPVGENTCITCGKVFIGYLGSQFCSKACYSMAQSTRRDLYPLKGFCATGDDSARQTNLGSKLIHNPTTGEVCKAKGDKLRQMLDSGWVLGKQPKQVLEEVLNHKVVSVKYVLDRQDVYDIQVEDNHNFPLSIGVFVHNCEDLLLPVWGDKDNLTVETLGGSFDVKWVADLEELRHQLVTALKVPYSMISGFSQEAGAGGFTPGQAMERTDIRFARQTRRLQRAVINGLTRLAQIHFAYLGMDPDPDLFEICMADASSAEELELQEALQKGTDATRSLYDLINDMVGVDLDKRAFMEYLNKKFWKLSDLDMDEILLKGNPNAIVPDGRDVPVQGVETPEGEAQATEEAEPNAFRESKKVESSDFKAALPCGKSQKLWEETWKDKPIKIVGLNEGTVSGSAHL